MKIFLRSNSILKTYISKQPDLFDDLNRISRVKLMIFTYRSILKNNVMFNIVVNNNKTNLIHRKLNRKVKIMIKKSNDIISYL